MLTIQLSNIVKTVTKGCWSYLKGLSGKGNAEWKAEQYCINLHCKYSKSHFYVHEKDLSIFELHKLHLHFSSIQPNISLH